jgi:cytochrome c biogenesis protein CcmG/thiol:disulfide interchange protein DsbE
MSGVRARPIGAVAVTVLLAAVAAAAAEPPGPAPPARSARAAATAQAPPGTTSLAPDFTRTDLTGRALQLSDFRGKVVLLNFWATWCEPCLAEIQTFSRWQREHGADGLQIVGVSMDDDPAIVADVVRKYQVAYPVVMGDEQLGNLYGGVLGLPLSYLIDSSGRVVARYQGEPKLTALEARLRTLLPRWRQ